jgi:hypothetical protein
MEVKIGDVVRLRMKHNDYGECGLVVDITQGDTLASKSWTTFDYSVMVKNGTIIHISKSCIEKVL